MQSTTSCEPGPAPFAGGAPPLAATDHAAHGALASDDKDESSPIAMLAPAALLRAQPALLADLKRVAGEVVAGGQYIMGPHVAAFERAAAQTLHMPHGVGVANGSDAILLALAALGVRTGDHVLVPAYTFVATAGSVARLGATVRFVDVCPACLTLAPTDAAAKCTLLTRAMVPVHLFGQAAHMAPLTALATSARLAVVEDVAQAFGVALAPPNPAWPAQARTTSFFPSKNLGGFGDAGLVACADESTRERLVALREHGSPARYVHDEISGNFRLDALQAALLGQKLPHLPAALIRRRANAAAYADAFRHAGLARRAPCTCAAASATEAQQAYREWREQFRDGVALPFLGQGRTAEAHTFNQYVVQFASPQTRDAVAAALGARRVGHSIYYPRSLHQQPCFAGLGVSSRELPVATHAAQVSLALPIAEHLDAREVRRVAEVVARAVGARA